MHCKQGKCLSRHLGLVCARFVEPGGRLPRLRQKVGLHLSFHDSNHYLVLPLLTLGIMLGFFSTSLELFSLVYGDVALSVA